MTGGGCLRTSCGFTAGQRRALLRTCLGLGTGISDCFRQGNAGALLRTCLCPAWAGLNQASLCGMHFWLIREPARIHFSAATHRRCDDSFGIDRCSMSVLALLIIVLQRMDSDFVTQFPQNGTDALAMRSLRLSGRTSNIFDRWDAPVQLKLNDPSRAWRRWRFSVS